MDYAGNGSYETIVPKFQKLVESRNGNGYYMRGTFTHANPGFTKDVFYMADQGFTQLSANVSKILYKAFITMVKYQCLDFI